MTFFSQARRACGTTLFIRLCTILHASGFELVPPSFADCCRDTYLINFLYKILRRVIHTNTFYSKFILKTQNCAHFAMLKMKRLNIYFLVVI
jgi:hypothetical protein